MRKLKRTSNYELSLEIKSDNFVQPPRDSQRNWILNQALREYAADIEHLDRISRSFVAGAEGGLLEDRTQQTLADDEIMEDWQIPVMKTMAESAVRPGGDILEIGFGRGIASDFIQERRPASHSIIECNDSVVERYHQWKTAYPGSEFHLYHSKWQDVEAELGQYDGIFFHTYPLNQDDFVEQVSASVTFAEHFFVVAARHLKPGGRFTYLSNEIDSLSRAHQRALLTHFACVELRLVTDLKVPVNTRDAMWGDSMLVATAVAGQLSAAKTS